MLAKQAFAKACERKESIDECGCGLGPGTSYRHNQVIKACGMHGLLCCTQKEYGYVKARFLGLLGAEGRAVKAEMHGLPERNELRVIQWKIVNKCKECGIPIAKAEGICRQMTRGKGLQEVEETRVLWNVFFKLRFYEGAVAA